MKRVKGWYIAELDLFTTGHPPEFQRLPIVEGETLTLPKSVKPLVCERGYHCCERLLNAFNYRIYGRITFVQVFGAVSLGGDKAAGRSRETLRIIPQDIADRECRLFAADLGERWLLSERQAGREPDAAYFAAVEIARRFALGDANKDELKEACKEAWMNSDEGAAAGTLESSVMAAYHAANQESWGAKYKTWAYKTWAELSIELENRLLKAIGEEP